MACQREPRHCNSIVYFADTEHCLGGATLIPTAYMPSITIATPYFRSIKGLGGEVTFVLRCVEV
jgi:hypothetical protein